MFWEEHDPFARTRSTQYKAVLFTHGKEQERLAKASAAALEKRAGKKVQTQTRPAGTFWIAEDYHQKYRLRSRSGLLADLLGLAAEDGAAVRDSTLAARVNGWLAGYGTQAEIEAEVKALGLSKEARKALQAALGDRAPILCR